MNLKKMAAAVLGITALLSLPACRTQLSVSPVKTNPELPEGQVYFLSRIEHLATLDRELVKCEVTPSLNLLAHAWLKSEVDALGDLREELRNSALRGLHPKCPTATHQPTSASLGNVLDRVKELLPKEPPAACGALGNDAYKKAYEDAFRTILRDFLRDPVLVSGVDWGSQCPKNVRSPESLTDSTDPKARLDQLNSCSAGFGPETELAEVNLSVLIRASVTPNILPDMKHAYSIDYLGMTKGTKQTEYLVEKYPNGTLKSVNSKIDDRTAQVIQGTLRGALRLAAASGGFPVTFAAVAGAQAGAAKRLPLTFEQWRDANEGKFSEMPLCTARILQLLRQRSDLEAQTSGASARILALIKGAEEATATAGKLTKEAAELQKQLDALPAGDAGRKALEEKIEKLKAEAKTQTAKAEQLLKDKATLEEAQGGSLAKFAAVRKQLTLTNTHLFRAEGAAGAEEAIKGADAASVAWFEPAALTKYCKPTILPCNGTIPTALLASIAGYLGPQPLRQTAQKPTGVTSLIYREPAHGLLLVCKEKACLDANGNLSATPEDTLLATLADFPQLGILAFLPLTNDTFQNNAIEASFSTSGSLEKLKYVSNARAEAAAKAFEGVSTDVLAFAEAKQGARKKELETEKAELDAEKALLEARLARDKARQALEDFHNPGTQPEPEPVPEPGGE